MVPENSFQITEFDPEVLREYDIRGVVDKNITENTEIITSNIIDSFAIIQLIFDLENIFQIKIEAQELNIENFKNARTIYEFIKKISKYD